jgi:hypothetical protein
MKTRVGSRPQEEDAHWSHQLAFVIAPMQVVHTDERQVLIPA